MQVSSPGFSLPDFPPKRGFLIISMSADEPSTGACAGDRRSIGFWCAVELKMLPTARVDDGLADCCDGSDEWQLKVG